MYGENLSQVAHVAQAARLAEQEGFEEEVILAAFLHDIGHLYAHELAEEGPGKLGADFLRERNFSEKIARLVEGQVEAKCYLTFMDEGYYEHLSEASKQTLEAQGGRMGETEARAFEEDELFDLSIRMRYWDEGAKEAGNSDEKMVQTLMSYREMMIRHLENRLSF